MSVFSLGLAFVAGLFSVLSPCVLPILPLVLAGAAGAHRFGAAALGLGVALSFTVIGLFVALIGFGLGLDGDVFRNVGGGLLIVLGLVLLIPRLANGFALVAAPVSNALNARFGNTKGTSLFSQFGLGLLLGMVWSPCVGPTLGAASLLAAQGRELPLVAATMLLFGLGAAVPLLLLGLLSRQVMMRLRGALFAAGSGGKLVLGGILVALGLMIVSGADKVLETIIVDHSPAWLIALTTQI